MATIEMLKPAEVDKLLRYPRGRTQRLAKSGRFPCIHLPDGTIRISRDAIDKMLTPTPGATAHGKDVPGA